MCNFKRIVISLIFFAGLYSQLSAADLYRVDAEWMQANTEQTNLVLLDVRDKDLYDIDHIPGAINLPEALTYQQKTTDGRIVEPDIFQGLMGERGIHINDTVVIYDDGSLIPASRVFWTLEVHGIKQVKILDKGYAGWLAAGLPITQQVREVAPSQFVPAVDHRRIASKFSTQLATVNPNQIIIDARSNEAYLGKVSTAKRFGHIPSAINVPVHNNLVKQENGTSLRQHQELQAVYADLPKGHKIIIYCDAGRASSTNYLALRELGYDVANYDASWLEWGNDFSLPVEN